MTDTIKVGIISDTHGRLFPEAVDALQGVDVILHAGDVETRSTLTELRKIAPVHVVRGNMDRMPETRDLPFTTAVELGEVVFYMVHILGDLDVNPQAGGFAAVVYGHTHRPEIVDRNGVLFINPGSASSPRGVPNPSVARLQIRRAEINAEIVEFIPAAWRNG